MKCKCGGNSPVIDTRYLADENAMRRRRTCGKCGAKFTTQETFVSDDLREFNTVKGTKTSALGFGYGPKNRVGATVKKGDNLVTATVSDRDKANHDARRRMEAIRDAKRDNADSY